MALEINNMTPCEWGQFVILDNTILKQNNHRNRNGYNYNPTLDTINEDDYDSEIMKSYFEQKEQKEDSFGKDGSMKTIIIRYAGLIAATCITIIMIPMWYFQY